MIFERLAVLAVVILTVTSLFLLLSQNWRWSIVALAVQYLAVSWLTAVMWPFGLAAVKLVAGLMAGAVLGASQPAAEQVEDPYTGSSTFIFRLLVAGLVWILIFPAAPLMAGFMSIPLAVSQAALLLIGMGLIHLGMTTRPLRVLVGLLTTLSGFELLYAGVEQSILVAGMLAVVTLGLALVGAYVMVILLPKESQP